jgi:hypothetical protein
VILPGNRRFAISGCVHAPLVDLAKGKIGDTDAARQQISGQILPK